MTAGRAGAIRVRAAAIPAPSWPDRLAFALIRPVKDTVRSVLSPVLRLGYIFQPMTTRALPARPRTTNHRNVGGDAGIRTRGTPLRARRFSKPDSVTAGMLAFRYLFLFSSLYGPRGTRKRRSASHLMLARKSSHLEKGCRRSFEPWFFRRMRKKRNGDSQMTVGRAATLHNGPWYSWAATTRVYSVTDSRASPVLPGGGI